MICLKIDENTEDRFFAKRVEERLRDIEKVSVQTLSSEQFWSDVEKERGDNL